MGNSLKEQVLSSVDIVDVVGERVALTRRGKDLVGLCPFHNDHKPSLSVSQSKQIFKCWACGAGGDAIRFIQLYQRVDFREALAILAHRAGIEMRRQARGTAASGKQRDELRKILEWACGHFRRNLQDDRKGAAAREYARARGLTPATLERFKLGLAGGPWRDLLDAARRAAIPTEQLEAAGLIVTSQKSSVYDRFRTRLMFPIADGFGRLVAFGGRTLTDETPKYLNSPETPLFNKSRTLFALDRTREAIRKTREAIVVEGYMDAVLLHQHGLENVVATLGTALSDAHARLLAPLADRVILCFDSDEAGRRAADRAVETALREKLDVRVAVMPAGEDPADCVLRIGAEGLRSVLQSAAGALEFKWAGTVAALSEGGGRGQREAVSAFIGFLARVVSRGGIDPIQQGLLVSRLSELLRLPAETIYEALATAHRKGSHAEARKHAEHISETSSYDASVRGLPAGLVAATEELCGLILEEPSLYGRVEESLGVAAQFCDAFARFYEVASRAARSDGIPRQEAMIAACDDAMLLDFIGRSRRRVRGRCVSEEYASDVAARLEYEVECLQAARLKRELERSGTASPDRDSESFRAFLELTRRQAGVFSLRHRSVVGTDEGAGLPVG